MSDESSISEARKVMPFAAKACDFCKKRKIRCEGVMPCIQCQRRGFPCNFTSEQHKRGPKPKKKRRETISAAADYDEESEVNPASEVRSGGDVSKLKMELEIQKRLEEHWKKQYFDLLQKQEDPTPKTLSLSSLDPASYLRTLLLNPNTTGLCLNPDQSPMQDQFSEISWSFIRDENIVYRLGQAFITCFNCGVIPTYNLNIDAADSVNQLIWKVIMLNTPLKINEFLKQESSAIVMQFFQSSLVYAHGIRAIDEEITYLDVANHLLLVINAAFNILFHQREVHLIPKYAKQLVHELMSLSNYLKYTGTGDAIKQLSPYLIQLIQQFENYIDDPELLANALSFLLSKSSTPSERDYWMTKMSAVSAKEPLNQVMKEFSVIYSALRVLVPGAFSTEMLYELQGRINVAELMLGTERLTHETKSFFSVWFSMAKAELYFRLNNMREHENAFKETLMRYYSLPRITFRKAMRGLSTLFTCYDGRRIMTADKIMQMVDETVIPYASVSRGLTFYPEGFVVPATPLPNTNSIVELPAVGLEGVISSGESDESPNDAFTSVSPDSLVNDNFDYGDITFSFDTLIQTPQ